MCLSLSVADWMQQVELWDHCRALGNLRDMETAALQRVEFKCAALKSALSIPHYCFSAAGWRKQVYEYLILPTRILHCPSLSSSALFLSVFFNSFWVPPLQHSRSVPDTHPAERQWAALWLWLNFCHPGVKASHATNWQKTSRNSTTMDSHTLFLAIHLTLLLPLYQSP